MPTPCRYCEQFFEQYKHNPDGECDCPKCQGMCECPVPLPKGYQCPKCKTDHEFPSYVFAHWDVLLTHTCGCGSVNKLRSGKVLK